MEIVFESGVIRSEGSARSPCVAGRCRSTAVSETDGTPTPRGERAIGTDGSLAPNGNGQRIEG
jgi:hypothetical protein